MPEENNKEDNLSNEPMVDLDTSGPGARVELTRKTERRRNKNF